MINRLSGWLNATARARNLAEVKAAMAELSGDQELKDEFAKLEFRDRLGIARDLVNLQRGKYQEWRMWGLVVAGIAAGIWKIVSWWLGHQQGGL